RRDMTEDRKESNMPMTSLPADIGMPAAIHTDSITKNQNDSALPVILSDTLAEINPDSVKKKLRNRSSWTADLSLTPFIPLQQQASVRHLQRTELTSGMRKEYLADKVHTSVTPGLAFSIAFRKKISKRLEIGTGLQYARIS